jgi:hypothetical protein
MKYLILLALIVCVSCKKSDNGLASERTSLLVGKKWQLTNYEVDRAGNNGTTTHQNLFFLIPDFSRDDYMVFRSDNIFEDHDNTIPTPNNGVSVREGKWSFEENGTVMKRTIYFVSDVRRDIISVTATEFKETAVDGNTTSTYTYTAIP